MSSVAAYIAFAALALAGALSTIRLMRPGTLPDRLLGLDSLVLVAVAALGTHIAWSGSGILLDVLVVAALLNFIGTVFIAGLIQERPK
ncbi:MAG: monovalent cation/H+ antiporter complex subunit F [Ilumatobacteraceae bacterium]